MRHSIVLLFAFVLVGASSTSQVGAAIVASFEFTGNDYTANPNNPIGANVSLDLVSSAAALPGVTLSPIRFSPGLDPTAALGQWADAYDGALGFSTDVNADRNFSTTTQTVYFNVDVASGSLLHLQELTFDSLKTRGDNPTGSRVTHAIFVNPVGNPSVDGLVGDVDFIDIRAHDHLASDEFGAESSGPSFSTGRWSVDAVDLSSFQSLSGENVLAIRTYSSEGFDRDFGLDSIVLRGQVTAIPEPNARLLLVAVTGFWMTMRRRREARLASRIVTR